MASILEVLQRAFRIGADRVAGGYEKKGRVEYLDGYERVLTVCEALVDKKITTTLRAYFISLAFSERGDISSLYSLSFRRATNTYDRMQ